MPKRKRPLPGLPSAAGPPSLTATPRMGFRPAAGGR